MFRKNVRIGAIIEKVVRKKTTVACLARQLGFGENRQHVYNIFKSKSIDTDIK